MKINKYIAQDINDAKDIQDRLNIFDEIIFKKDVDNINIQEASTYLRKFCSKKVSEDNFHQFKKISGNISGNSLANETPLDFTGKSISLIAYESMRRKYMNNEKLPENDILFFAKVHNKIPVEGLVAWENTLVKQGISALLTRDVVENRKKPLTFWNWELHNNSSERHMTIEKALITVKPILFKYLSNSMFVLSELQSLKFLADKLPEFTTDCAKNIKDMQSICEQDQSILLEKRKEDVLHLHGF